MNTMQRREFLRCSLAAGAGVGLGGYCWAAPADAKNAESVAVDEEATVLRPIKSVQVRMLPSDVSFEEQAALAHRCGFRGLEASPVHSVERAREMGRIARDAGVPIHSVCYGGWGAPLSSPDSATIDRALGEITSALQDCRAMGAEVLLLVPAVVSEDVSYADAYRRSQEHLRKLFPAASEAGVTIAIENVWNKFLLSPLEFARYIDELGDPCVKAYFDVGNVIIFGFAQHWIRTLGPRIARVHLKDFKRGGYEWKPLLEGDVNWKEVHAALGEIGYDSYLTPELAPGDEACLRDIANRMDRIISGSV